MSCFLFIDIIIKIEKTDRQTPMFGRIKIHGTPKIGTLKTTTDMYTENVFRGPQTFISGYKQMLIARR